MVLINSTDSTKQITTKSSERAESALNQPPLLKDKSFELHMRHGTIAPPLGCVLCVSRAGLCHAAILIASANMTAKSLFYYIAASPLEAYHSRLGKESTCHIYVSCIVFIT